MKHSLIITICGCLVVTKIVNHLIEKDRMKNGMNKRRSWWEEI